MTNQYPNFQYQTSFQQTQFSPQPQGIAYVINSSNELNNIPLNSTTTIAFCFPEELCYIRTLQNGTPIITPYKISPITEDKNNNDDILTLLKKLDQRVKNLEKNSKRSESLDELL